MKLHNLDNIYLSKRSMLNAVLLLNQCRANKQVHFRNMFETKLATYLNVKHAFACNSGTNGLHVALLSLGVTMGDEVITNPLNYNIGTIASILQCGAKPILANITKDGVMDVDDVERRISLKTKAIIAVHLNGFTENLDVLKSLRNKYGVFIVEDACQAFGSKVRIGKEWKNAGSVGDIGIYSFGLFKLITTIEGGAVVTNSHSLARRVEASLGFGFYKKEEFILGFNSRMDHLRAGIGLGNLELIDSIISERSKRWFKYYNSLTSYQWLKIFEPNKDQSINYMSAIVCIQDKKIRARLIKLLLSVGYDVNLDYKRSKLNRFFESSVDQETKEHIRNFKESNISLPTHHGLNESDIDSIVECFRCVNMEVGR